MPSGPRTRRRATPAPRDAKGKAEWGIRQAARQALSGDLTMVSAGMASQGMVLPALVLQSRADETGEALADVIPVSLLRPYIQATKYKVIGQTIFMMVLAMGVHTGAIAPDNPMTAPIRPQIDQTIALMEMQRQAQAEAEAVGAAPDQSA